MFRLLKLGFTLGCLGAVAWFAVSVKLGERTLYDHARAISGSEESQELVKGTRQKVSEMKDEVGRKIFGAAPGPQNPEAPGKAEKVEKASSGDPAGSAEPAVPSPASDPSKPAGEQALTPGQPPRFAREQAPSDELSETDRRDMKRLLEAARQR